MRLQENSYERPKRCYTSVITPVIQLAMTSTVNRLLSKRASSLGPPDLQSKPSGYIPESLPLPA